MTWFFAVLIVLAVMAVMFLFLLLFVGKWPAAITAFVIGWIGWRCGSAQ